MRVHRNGFKCALRLQRRGRLAICVSVAILAVALACIWEKHQVLAQQQGVPSTVSTPAQHTNSPVQPSLQTASAAQPEAPLPVAASSGTEGMPNTKVSEESANLLKLATSLKADVDKTTKDTLSVAVVREAGEIEQLAHKMRTQ